MSREIKFRAWQSATKTMFYNIEKGTGDSHNPNPPFADYLENKNMVVMQYTGFKDKSGKDIYEGDIVRWDGNAASFFPVIFSVEYGAWIFQIEPFSEFDEPKMLVDFAPYSEVVGNIYENSELLEQST